MKMNILYLFIFNFLAKIKCGDYQGKDEYLGCYVDYRLARDLNKLPGMLGNVWIGSNSNMTVNACINLCRSFTLPYAGLEFSNECYCGETYGRYGRVSESECSYRCNGNSNQICGGLDRLSIYSVRILVRSELIVVLNGSILKNDFTTVRLAQTSNLDTWIDFVNSTGQIKIFSNYGRNSIAINALRSDLLFNQFYIFLSLRGNQLATFYNCYINDALMLDDTSLANKLLGLNTIPVNANVIFNKNLNEVFNMYGCINYQDGYQQIFSHTNNLVKSYCKLTLTDMENVNSQIDQLIAKIDYEKNSISNLYSSIRNTLEYCGSKPC